MNISVKVFEKHKGDVAEVLDRSDLFMFSNAEPIAKMFLTMDTY